MFFISKLQNILTSFLLRHSIYLISQKWLGEKTAEKNYKKYFRSNNYEVCTAVARCFPNILDVMVLENINLSLDKIGRPPLWSNDRLGFLSSIAYISCQQCIFQPNVNFIYSSEKIT
jgi:hypothetical protein